MSRRRQSKSMAWRRRQEADIHVRTARAEGYRSRAVYKLLEIAGDILRRNITVIDLGAAPGGWSQIAQQKVGSGGCVVAVDILPITAIEGVQFIHGDFTDAAVQQQISQIAVHGADVVLSDMAPNLSGIAVRDQANMQELFNAALHYCQSGGLKKGGDFLIKTFAGETHSDCRQAMKPLFSTVKIITPDATRRNSRECYLLGRGFKAGKIFV